MIISVFYTLVLILPASSKYMSDHHGNSLDQCIVIRSWELPELGIQPTYTWDTGHQGTSCEILDQAPGSSDCSCMQKSVNVWSFQREITLEQAKHTTHHVWPQLQIIKPRIEKLTILQDSVNPLWLYGIDTWTEVYGHFIMHDFSCQIVSQWWWQRSIPKSFQWPTNQHFIGTYSVPFTRWFKPSGSCTDGRSKQLYVSYYADRHSHLLKYRKQQFNTIEYPLREYSLNLDTHTKLSPRKYRILFWPFGLETFCWVVYYKGLAERDTWMLL